jgi:hypothetical protein
MERSHQLGFLAPEETFRPKTKNPIRTCNRAQGENPKISDSLTPFQAREAWTFPPKPSTTLVSRFAPPPSVVSPLGRQDRSYPPSLRPSPAPRNCLIFRSIVRNTCTQLGCIRFCWVPQASSVTNQDLGPSATDQGRRNRQAQKSNCQHVNKTDVGLFVPQRQHRIQPHRSPRRNPTGNRRNSHEQHHYTDVGDHVERRYSKQQRTNRFARHDRSR